MGWAAIAGGIASFFISYDKSQQQRAAAWSENRIARANATATNVINEANADAANLVRRANNDFTAAQAAFQTTKRTLGNKARLDALGKQHDALAVNESRQIDAMTRGRLSQQLAAATALGALRANSAARGVGGSSADAMRAVASLALGSAETQMKDKKEQITYDTLLQRSGLIRTAALSLDLGANLPNLDYGINVAPLVQAPVYLEQGSALRDAFRGLLGSQSWSNVGQVGNTGTQTQGVSTNWYQYGANSASGYNLSFGNAQGNGQEYGLSTYTGTSRPTYARSGYTGVFTDSGGSSGSSGWFSGDTGGGTGGADNSFFSGA